ncbi:DUF885 family protein [Erythrobacter arachoides]|uniref:DUF885 family protein n=1 Tax=Aurantiacibacter arachoides TaxID=1850444 RepID=A0A845A0U6_9SPHN|nr:DUF885 domain-containing protein [Aurantiacibacter arachoides]MXO93568.1 DUF885 family protein [Aurantiacibacter arachoides]GGD48370.1 Tat pathway signal protein [Aurantiacibacter arachoides]
MHKPFDLSLSRRQLIGAMGATTALSVLPGCVTTPAAPAQSAAALLDSFAWNLLEHEPARATSLAVDTGAKSYLRGRLADATPAGQDAYAATLRADLARARAFPRDGLDPATRTSFEVVESAYSTALEGFALPYGDIPVGTWRTAPYVVIQNVGAYNDIPRFLDSEHPIKTREDAEAYLSRLEAIPGVMRGELERIRQARSLGVVPPDFLLDKAITAVSAQRDDAAQGGSLVESLVRRTREEGIPGNWRDRAQALVTGGVAPALGVQLAELQTQRGMARSAPGMNAQPGGEEWYRWALKSSTTTDRSAQDIHRLGMDTLADIHGRMDPLLRDLGYASGNPGQRMVQLGDDDRFKFSPGDTGRAEVISFLEERIDWIRAQMPRAFRRVIDPAVEVRRIPVNEEAGAAGAYGGAPAIDGSRPGIFWINLGNMEDLRQIELPTLAHHEAIPGHVWEGEYSNQLPLIRAILAFNAFSEGWALYSEQLADELGAYDDNPAWRLGYMNDAAFRAVRLVVDTGIHALGWDRERAIAFYAENLGKSREDSAREIDRYCSWPGQACGYMVGKLEILRQRERAMAALGSRYDLRDFNQAVVDAGNTPLDVLAGNIGRFIGTAGG